MSVTGLRYAMTVPKLTASERLLFIFLAERADKNGECFPSQSWMSKRTGLCIRTVRDAMKGLVNKGHMEREKRTGPKGRSSDTLRLRLPLEPAKSAATPRQIVPTIPSSSYEVGIKVEEEGGKGAWRDGACGLRLVHSAEGGNG